METVRVCRSCGLPKNVEREYLVRASGYVPLDCAACERGKARRRRKARYGTEEGRRKILETNAKYQKSYSRSGRMAGLRLTGLIQKYANNRRVLDPYMSNHLANLLCSGLELVGCSLDSNIIKLVEQLSPLCGSKTEFYEMDGLEFLGQDERKYGLVFISRPALEEDGWADNFGFPLIERCRAHLESDGYIMFYLRNISIYQSILKANGFKRIEHQTAVHIYKIVS